jgi:hypothetical protein
MLPYNDKYYGLKKNKNILGKGICSIINDCSNAIVLLNSNSTLLQEKNDPSQCYDGFSYNARPMFVDNKIFIISIRHLLGGEEIFYPYGWSYWKVNYRFQQKLQPTNVKIKENLYSLGNIAKQYDILRNLDYQILKSRRSSNCAC